MLFIQLCFQLQIPANNTKDLKCFNLHHGKPYLQLGPFKYEMILKEPEIGLFHQLITPQEAENMKNLAKSKMISTPYNVGGRNELFSKLRTSKIMYMNENLKMCLFRIAANTMKFIMDHRCY